MVEVISTVASVPAVIELAAKISQVCFQYISKVSHANKEILRLQTALKQLQSLYEDARQKSAGNRLPITKKIVETSDDCRLQLNVLHKKLEISTTRRLTARITSQALKWPLTSSEVEQQVQSLQNFFQRMQTALQIDTISLLDDIGKENILSRLTWVEGATYDAFEASEEVNAICLRDTRVDLLKEIRNWIADPDSKSIFWLSGMAGTGKSTISRTLATELAENKQLCANFFFKEGEGDRGNAKRFFTTVAAQLIRSIPTTGPVIRKALEDDPQVGSKTLKEQFGKLIFEPLSTIKDQRTTPVVLIVDALDECKPDWHIEIILDLFSTLRNLQPLQIRVFVTSRPERAPRYGFHEITPAGYHDLILHEIPEHIIKHDIAIFLEYEFTKIRKKRLHLLDKEDWPGKTVLSTLIAKSQPLFIYASTICRFIGTGRYPESRLEAVLSDRNDHAFDKVHQTYRPVLDKLLEEHKEAEADQRTMLNDFQEIVGPIVIMFEPLTVDALGKLLDIDSRRIWSILDDLQSLIHVPVKSDKPVRPLHLSFPNFLLDGERRNTHRFWLDRQDLHKSLARRCVDILLGADCLSTPDICHLKSPGFLRSDVPQSRIDQYLHAEVQYACRFWIRHLVESQHTTPALESSILIFLSQRSLFWLEALGLLGRVSETITMLGELGKLFEKSSNSALISIIYDIKRFVLANSFVADLAPLQLHSSCIVFAPKKSNIKIKHKIPSWLGRVPEAEEAWGSCQQTLVEHTATVSLLAYSLDDKLLASASEDNTIKLWDTDTGRLLQSSNWQWDDENNMVFSPEGLLLASTSSRGKGLEIRNVNSGRILEIPRDRTCMDKILALSMDGKLLAVGRKHGHIELFDIHSNPVVSRTIQTADSNDLGTIYSLVFSSDNKLLASGSSTGTVEVWDIETRNLYHVLQEHYKNISTIAFSPNNMLLASGSEDHTIRLWNVKSGSLHQLLMGHTSKITSVTFSSDSKQLASGAWDDTVRLWDVDSGNVNAVLEGHSHQIVSVAFSTNGLLASGSSDGAIRLWHVASHSLQQELEKTLPLEGEEPIPTIRRNNLQPTNPQQSRSTESTSIVQYSSDSCRNIGLTNFVRYPSESVYALTTSPNGEMLAGCLSDGQIQVWDMRLDEPRLLYSFNTHSGDAFDMRFSPNSKLLAISLHEGGIELWNMDLDSEQPQLLHSTTRQYEEGTLYLQFSNDSRLLVSGAWIGMINLWDVGSMQVVQSWQSEKQVIRVLFHDTLPQLIADVVGGNTERFMIDESIPFTPQGCTKVSVHNGWLVRNDQRLVWLPMEWRRRIISPSGDLAAVCLEGNRIGFFEILPEELKRAGLLREEAPRTTSISSSKFRQTR